MPEPKSSSNQPSRPRRLLALQRQRQAFQMRLAGATEYEISKQLGVSQPAVSHMLTKARAELSEEVRLDQDQYHTIQLHDIFSALSVIRQKLTSKDAGEQLAAIDRLNRLHERLARLEGLDAPAKTDMTSGGQAIAVVAVAVDMARFAPPDDDDDDLHDPSGSDGG